LQFKTLMMCMKEDTDNAGLEYFKGDN